MNDFKGKVVMITGAGSGIGRALGKELARRGAALILADINGSRLKDAAAGMLNNGGTVETVRLDVADQRAVKAIIDDIVIRKGRLDYLFNNAGIAVGGEARDCAPEDWTSVLNVNLYGVIHGITAAYPHMVKQGFGHIVNTASIEGLVPLPCSIGYTASKYGVVGLSNALRIEGKDLGIKVSVVCPGFIDTAIFHDSKMIGINRQKTIESLASHGQMSPEKCARIILQGVLRNKAIITVSFFARILWMLHRLSPAFVLWLMERQMDKFRREVRMN